MLTVKKALECHFLANLTFYSTFSDSTNHMNKAIFLRNSPVILKFVMLQDSATTTTFSTTCLRRSRLNVYWLTTSRIKSWCEILDGVSTKSSIRYR